MSKIKILLVGSVGSHIDVLQAKLESLQSSKAGPFDVCFCVGDIQLSNNNDNDNNNNNNTDFKFPLPVYLQEYSGPTETREGGGGRIVPLAAAAEEGANLFYLQGDPATRDKQVQLLEVKLPNHEHELVVGCCAKHLRLEPSAAAAAADVASRTSKEQLVCDLLLSSDWPQGMEDVVNVDTEPLSFDLAQVAVSCRPRYHVAPSTQHFHQSPPYALPNSDHVGRFLALAPVVPGKTSKSTKFIHALGLTPLSANPPPTTAPSTLPCPFASPTLLGKESAISATINGGGGPSKPVPGFVAAAHASDSGAYSRFATSRKRQRDDGNQGEPVSLEPPDDPNIKTLFLYGLHKDVTGQLQSTDNTDNPNHKVFQAFSQYGLTQVRYPPNAATSTYCFLEFPDQKAALACLLDCQGHKTIDSVELTVKWATPNTSHKRSREQQQHVPERHYVTEAEAPDSTTLYFHPPKGTENDDEFSNALCLYLQATLEKALNDGNEDERITAETEPALKVTVRRKDQYGFLEFASHAAATMALAAVTQRTDGGLVQSKQEEEDAKPLQPSHLVGTTLRWAKGEPPKSKRQELLEALGLERQFFEADTRTDCWFCLASPTCETHLITGVYKEWYAAMPKGPVHPGHVLLVPVTHTRQGAWTLSSEWTELVDRMAEHASQAYDCDLFVFERAMETKGGYHSHVNCVPIPRKGSDVAMKLQTTMMTHAKASGFDLRPIQSDLGMEALIPKNAEDHQYFYAEIRTRRQSHRFLYQQQGDEGRSSVPLQFAREVLAAVLHNPKLAHWKSCVVDKETEAQLAKDFRESFSKNMEAKEQQSSE